MAVQGLNAPQIPSNQQGVQGARAPQPQQAELQKPREADQVNVSQAALDRIKADEARLSEGRRGEASVQEAAIQTRKEETQRANTGQDRGRVDLTA